jgi:ankyrin repeat protein
MKENVGHSPRLRGLGRKRLIQLLVVTLCIPSVSSLASTAPLKSSPPLGQVSQNDNKMRHEGDQRPYEQRANGPRLARRLNHAFKYLYRHCDNERQARTLQNTSATDYLAQYYSLDEIFAMNQTFPPLLQLNVSRHLHPKMKFLQETMGLSPGSLPSRNPSSNCEAPSFLIPPHYFGARLERTIAPRHAFLIYHGLPHGPVLMEEDASKWKEFLMACRSTKHFAALCQQWKIKSSNRQENQSSYPSPFTTARSGTSKDVMITSKHIEAFDAMFGRGVLAAARNEVVQWNNTWPLQYTNISSAELLRLLIHHGSNPLERDNRGVSLLHWAAGTGNLAAVHELLPHFETHPSRQECGGAVMERARRDGATPLHWAAAGATAREFGTGGHADVCRYLIDACARGRAVVPSPPASESLSQKGMLTKEPTATNTATRSTISTKELVNALTYDGNSALMWASWSGTLETVKLLIRNRADASAANRNGCTVAHWAASGGNVEVCDYLATIAGVDFFKPNHGGNTPLTHAVAFGRLEVVQWLRRRQELLGGGSDDATMWLEEDLMAANLARDFVHWKNGDTTRQKILQLFQGDDIWYDTDEQDEGNRGRSGGAAIDLEQEYQELL